MARKPEKPVCSIDGCERLASSRGWCKAHHKRWLRHGDPAAGRTPNGAAAKFISEALASDTDDCVLWPFSFSSGGYGSYYKDGKSTTAHRVVCEEAHGVSSLDAAHNCGNRRCVNPRHLRWATAKSNHADKVLHGTAQRGEAHPNAKLTDEQVATIRAIEHQTLSQIANQFGVAKSTVGQIRSGRGWSHVA